MEIIRPSHSERSGRNRQGDRCLREGVSRVVQLSDAELMRIAMGGHAAETVTPVSRRRAAPL